jgi:hypothetical protein
MNNPAQILYDENGNPHAVIDGQVIPLALPTLAISGKNDDGYAEILKVDGGLKVKNINQEKISKYDVTSTIIYIGTADKNTLDSDPKWTISRFLLDINGNPTEKKISSKNVIWNNRAGLTYS